MKHGISKRGPYGWVLFRIMFSILLSSSHGERFSLKTILNDKVCSSGDLVFNKTTPSVIFCAFLCELDSECGSMFYHQVDTRCYGCRNVYTNDTTLSALEATTHYKRIVHYQGRCLDDSQCFGNQQVCEQYLRVCVCVIGYHYSSSTNTCQTSCTSYGDTFQMYPKKGLFNNDLKVFDGIDTQTCLLKCRIEGSFVCRSVDYSTAITRCYLTSATALTKPNDLFSNSYLNFYMRNCA